MAVFNNLCVNWDDWGVLWGTHCYEFQPTIAAKSYWRNYFNLDSFYKYSKKFGLQERQIRSKLRERLVYLFALPMGFYEGLFGSGNGLFFSIISAYTKGFDLIDALGHYFAFGFFWVLLAALILISKGYFDLSLMIPAVLGSLTGGYMGSKFARLKGNKFIKMVFTISGIILGLKLLLGL